MKRLIFVQANAFAKGGLARAVNGLVNELYLTGKYDIEVLSLGYGDGKMRYPLVDGVKLSCLNYEYFNLRKDTLSAARKLKHFYPRDIKATFIIAEIGNVLLAELGLSRYKNIKKIVWLHTYSGNGKRYGFAGIGRKIALRKFDTIITLTKEDKHYLYQQYGASSKILQIYNLKDKALKRGTYDIHSKKIISCGELISDKGHDLAIQVASILFKNEAANGWQWDIYGEGGERKKLEKMILDYGLQGRVNLMGYHNDIYDLYQEYAMGAFLSENEGCPMVMVEALTAGLPMVSFGFPCGPKDMISDGENGFIVEPGDVLAMADKLLLLISDTDLRKKCADNSDINLVEMEIPFVIRKWMDVL